MRKKLETCAVYAFLAGFLLGPALVSLVQGHLWFALLAGAMFVFNIACVSSNITSVPKE
jgi:hypothetical protein